MDLKRLKYFCTLVEHGSFSKAATSLYISQPPLSQRIRELEHELGVELVHRTSKSFQVTPAGLELYRRAQFILSYINSFEKDFSNSSKEPAGLVRVGVCPPCATLFLAMMPKITEAYPKLAFRLWIMDNQSLERHMQEVHLDFCLAQLPLINQNYRLITLTQAPFCAVYGQGITPPEKDGVSLEDLTGVPLLLSRRRDGGGSYEILMKGFQTAGLEPTILLDTQDLRGLLELIAFGVKGVAIVPATEIPADFPWPIRTVELAALKTSPVLFFLRKAYLSKAAKLIMQMLHDVYGDDADISAILENLDSGRPEAQES